MKKYLLFVIFTLNYLISYSQEKNFLLNRPLLSAVDSIEKVNKGEEFKPTFTISVSKDYFPNADKFDLANPLIFFRNGNTYSTEMNYYFSLPDSTIRLISYSWEGTPKLSDELNALFETNADYFLKYFGYSGEIKNETHDTWAQKSLTWGNDIVHVYQFMVSGKNTNRVRVLISWK